MYQGEGEALLRDTFTKARQMAPCIVLVDELDGVAPARGAEGESGGVATRLLTTFLTGGYGDASWGEYNVDVRSGGVCTAEGNYVD